MRWTWKSCRSVLKAANYVREHAKSESYGLTPTHDHDVDVGQKAAVAVGRFTLVDAAVLRCGVVEHHGVIQHLSVVFWVVWQQHRRTQRQHESHFTRAATTNVRLSRLNTCKLPAEQIWRHGWKIITVSTLTTFVMGTSKITDNKLKKKQRLHCVNTLWACCVPNRPVFLSISRKQQGPIFFFFQAKLPLGTCCVARWHRGLRNWQQNVNYLFMFRKQLQLNDKLFWCSTILFFCQV